MVHRRKKGHGILDTLKKVVSGAKQGLEVAKAISAATGIKPSAHVKHALVSSALKSAGLGRKRVHHRKRGGCMGQGKVAMGDGRSHVARGTVGNMGHHMAEARAHKVAAGRRIHRVGGLQTQSGSNNYPNAASIGVVRF